MLKPQIPENEKSRLESLQELQILDTAPEEEFDSLVKAAAIVCDVPISAVSLLDSDRQWFKASTGLEGVNETPRDIAFCAHAINGDEIFEVTDAESDPTFSDNPLVTGDPNIRFYAGAPLRLSDGSSVGTLCVIDTVPRKLSKHQREVLGHLATAAVAALEGRRALLNEQKTNASANQSAIVLRHSIDAIVVYDTKGRISLWNGAAEKMYGYSKEEMLGNFMGIMVPASEKEATIQLKSVVDKTLEGIVIETVRQRKNGSKFSASVSIAPIFGDQQEISGYISTTRDISDQVNVEQLLAESEAKFQAFSEGLPIGVYALDLEGGCIYTNPSCQNIFGFTLEESLGEGWRKNIHPDDMEKIDPVNNSFIKNGSDEVELSFRIVRSSGQTREVRSTFRKIFNSEHRVTGFVGSIVDETDRRKTEIALLTAHQRMSLATECGGIGVWEYDPITEGLKWDSRIFYLHGLDPAIDEESNETWLLALHPDDRKAAQKKINDNLSENDTFEFEYRVVWKDGSVHHIRSSARISRDQYDNAVRMIGVCWDVTEFHQLSEQVAAKHELLRITLDSIADAVITTDANGEVNWLNPVAETLTGWSVEQAKGQQIAQVFNIVNQASRQAIGNSVEACLENEEVISLNNQPLLISSDGVEYGIEDTAAPIFDEHGQLQGTVLAFRDVTEGRKMASEMSYRATHDKLTGLINREEFEARLERCLSRAKTQHSSHALLYVDLDQFKLINDACGHHGGDELLQQVSKILKETIRGRDTIARFGGDEFALILEYCSVEEAQIIAQNICDLLDQSRFLYKKKRFRIGASVGLVVIDDRWDSIVSLMQAADTSCYVAKDGGRNRVHTWFDSDAAMQARQAETQWATRLEQALDEDRFVVYAQKIFPSNGDSKGVRAEVLIRLPDEDGNMILPGLFLPAAERFNLCSRIDRWVLNSVVEMLRDNENLGGIENLAVNISGQSIGDPTFHIEALKILESAGAEVTRRLSLEITETSVVTNIAEASTFILQVQNLGVQVALDDFGAGASSFGYLKSMPVDILKIDGQFIQNLMDDPLNDVAVRCFVDVAEVVGVKTVAEYVDREDIFERLKELNVDYAQGFWLHKPEPIEQILSQKSTAPILKSTA